jgi:hypothetical protein
MMTFLKKNFNYLIILTLIVIIILQRSCNSSNIDKKTIVVDGKKYNIVKQVIDTAYITKTQTVYKPGKTIYQDSPVYITMPTNVDTALILKEFYALRVYKDTLKLTDSLGYISVIDSISKNVLLGRTWNAKVNKIVIDSTLYLKDLPKNQIYIGPSLGMQRPLYTTFGGTLLLKTKNDHIYGIGAGVNSQLHAYFQGTILWKISLKK